MQMGIKMIKHIVMWRLKEENKEKNALILQEKLMNLMGVIPEIIDMEVGINVNSADSCFDVVLSSLFVNMEELGKYQVNPLHREVAEYLKTIQLEKAFVDYEIN
jgi:hypothetical protein